MKKIEKVYFIEAKSPSSHIFSFVKIFRLGSVLLATILRNLGFKAKVFIEDIKEVYDESKDEIIKEELFGADIIGISTITSTAMRAYKIAKKFRDKGIPVIIGGPHVTFLPDEGLDYADYVVRGEGEETIVELINALNAHAEPHATNEVLEKIKGLSWRDRCCGCKNHNPGRGLVKDLNEAPIPDFNLIADWEDKNVIPIATSRGCTFGCRFCSVIKMFGRGMRFKSVARIVDELKEAVRYSPRHIFFIDDNFAANKKRAKEICKAIIKEGLDFNWSAQVRTDIIDDPELVDLMVKAGCVNVFIGFESINPETLLAYEKRQDLDKIRRCIAVLKEAKLKIHGMFVIDPDIDDFQTIKDTVKFTKDMDLDSIQFLALTPLPGTPVFDDIEKSGRLLHKDWSKYDAHHIVFKPKLISVEDLQVGLLRGMRSFYGWKYSLKWLARACSFPFSKKSLVEGFFYASIGVYGRKTTKEALQRAPKYLETLRETISIQAEREKYVSGC